MNVFTSMLASVEDFFEAQMAKYREAYLAQVQQLPESDRKTGHRGVYLP